jgi:N-acetyltransferase
MSETEAPGVLEGELVRLERLVPEHAAGLATAAAEERMSYAFTAVPDSAEKMRGYVEQLCAARDIGEVLPFVQRRLAGGELVGVTSFLNLRRWARDGPFFAVEIGNTWLAASAQRSGLNVEAKLLLLGQAFDGWGVGRVDLKTDARNARSRDAIEALGATFEGVLRHWQPSQVRGEDGALRDTAMYSITADEWPAVHERLRERLNRRRG